MRVVTVMFIYFFILLLHLTESFSRQKRCIVIQKQSGTHGDSSEGDDDRDVEPRKPDRRADDRHNRRNVENAPPDSEFLRYKTGPAKKLSDVARYRNKLTSIKNRFL